ncbi:MAG: permease [Bdellovibrionales bacterium]
MSNCCHTPEASTPSCCSTDKKKIDLLFWTTLALVIGLYLAHWTLASDLSSLPWLAQMAATSYTMINSVWWGVLVGFIFVALLSKVPRAFIMALFGQGGTIGGLLRATGAGILLDLCSHGILMIGARLYERGASAGQVIAFLLASPWNSFSLTLILISLIGLPWTLAFIVLSMVIALITGWLFDRLVGAGVLPANPHQEAPAADFAFWPEVRKGLHKTAFTPAFFKEMLGNALQDSRIVMRWLLVGILLAGLLRAFVPPDLFAHSFGPSLTGLVLTMILTTILEVCSEGSTPIAADILTRAHAPGNAFAFLMAGVATDYTEIMVLKDTTKSWRIAMFLPLLSTPQIFLASWLINSQWGG